MKLKDCKHAAVAGPKLAPVLTCGKDGAIIDIGSDSRGDWGDLNKKLLKAWKRLKKKTNPERRIKLKYIRDGKTEEIELRLDKK